MSIDLSHFCVKNVHLNYLMYFIVLYEIYFYCLIENILVLYMVHGHKYCQNTICEENHTLCAYNNCQLNCGDLTEVIQFDEKTINLILKLHNFLRSNVSSGFKYSFLPQAIDMGTLKYSAELAFIAQCWANQCRFGEEDYCKRSGENYFP